jgi:hypothetical protein
MSLIIILVISRCPYFLTVLLVMFPLIFSYSFLSSGGERSHLAVFFSRTLLGLNRVLEDLAQTMKKQDNESSEAVIKKRITNSVIIFSFFAWSRSLE